MKMLIIFVLLFTFALKAEGTCNDIKNMNDTDNNRCATKDLPKNNTSECENKTEEDKGNGDLSKNNTSECENKTADGNKSEESKGNGDLSKSNTSECEKDNNENEGVLSFFSLKMIVIFFMGVIFGTITFSTVLCFATICNGCRAANANKDKESIILEAVKSQHDQSMIQSDEDQTDAQAPLQAQTAVEVSVVHMGNEEQMKIFGNEQTEGAGEVSEVDYASINYSLLQKKDGDLQPQKMESDYAEIQLKKSTEGEEVETLQDGEEQAGVKEHEVKQVGVAQDEVKQDGVDQGLKDGMES